MTTSLMDEPLYGSGGHTVSRGLEHPHSRKPIAPAQGGGMKDVGQSLKFQSSERPLEDQF